MLKVRRLYERVQTLTYVHLDSEALAGKMSGLPLALAQASAYIEQTGITTTKYLELYENWWQRWMEMQAKFPLADYGERSVLTTWNISYDQVMNISKGAAALIRLWAFLDCNDIRYDLVRAAIALKGQDLLTSWLRFLAHDELTFIMATGTLYKLSLIDRKQDRGEQSDYVMHSVLHDWCAYLGTDAERLEMCWLAARLIGACVPKGRSHYRSADRELLPHILQLYRRIKQGTHRPRSRDELQATIRITGVLIRRGRLQEARGMSSMVLEAATTMLEPTDSLTMSARHHMGWIESEQGNFAGAASMYRQALEGKLVRYGYYDHSIVKTIRNLGSLLMKQRQYEEAIRVFQGHLIPLSDPADKLIRSISSTAHCDILDSFGSACGMTGRLNEARRAFQMAIKAKETLLGTDNISTLDTVRNFALFEKSQGHLEGAECLLRRCLSGQERAELLGPENADTARTMRDLGNVLAGLFQLDEADRLLKRALSITRNTFGASDYRTLEVEFDLNFLRMLERNGNTTARFPKRLKTEHRHDYTNPISQQILQPLSHLNHENRFHYGEPTFHAGDDLSSHQGSSSYQGMSCSGTRTESALTSSPLLTGEESSLQVAKPSLQVAEPSTQASDGQFSLEEFEKFIQDCPIDNIFQEEWEPSLKRSPLQTLFEETPT